MPLKDLIDKQEKYYEITLPTTKKKLHIRRMKLKDKKDFLISIDSQNDETILPALETLLQSIIKEKVKLDNFTIEDLMYLVVENKKLSEGNTIDISYTCKKCNAINETQFDLNKDFDIKPTDLKPINIEDFTFGFKPLSYKKFFELNKKYSDGIEYNFNYLLEIIDKIVYQDEVYQDFTKKELKEFLENLDINIYIKLLDEVISKIGHAYLYKEDKCVKCGDTNILLINDVIDFLKL